MGEGSLCEIPLSPKTITNQNNEQNIEEPIQIQNLNSDSEDSLSSQKFQKTSSSSSLDSSSSSQELEKSSTVETQLPSAYLPQPEPPCFNLPKSKSQNHDSVQFASDLSSISNFFRERSNSLSSAFSKHLSQFTESPKKSSFTEINLSGLKVIVQKQKSTDGRDERSKFDMKGRISFFSRSNSRDCTAVRTFFREKALPFVEINIDVFPERKNELMERSGSLAVPMIFVNEKLLGGLVVLNTLRNSGEFERRVVQMGSNKCPESAPKVPAYGFDDEVEMKQMKVDAIVEIVRVLRQKLPIQDRLTKMKIVKNCFSGSEMVEVIIQHYDCGRKKAIEIGKEIARKHFIHHVFRENDFEDGHNQFHRFLEHDPAIPKCFNFRGATNDDEPQPAHVVGEKLTKLMSAILEAYASDDRRHLDYSCIATSEEFRRYVNMVQDLQRVDIFTLSVEETMIFFLNLYNAMVIHAVIRVGKPGLIDKRAFFSDFQYIVGGYPYSLNTIKNGILRSNRRQPYSFIKPFNVGDKRLKVALSKVEPLIHFGLCNGARSSPTVRFFPPQGVELELKYAAREFFLDGGIEIDLSKRTVYLSPIIKWYDADFAKDRELLKWILNYLDATKSGLLTHLLSDGSQINIAYQSFDWSLNL